MARYFYELNNAADLPAVRAWALDKKISVRFLGGGSNVVLPAKIDALVIKNNLAGVSIIGETADSVHISCASGESWHPFVMERLTAGHFGLENLALIPGTVGGAPIQNIGAYGVEVNRFITRVSGFNFETGKTESLLNNQCLFAYRDSIFKTPKYKNFFVTNVEFELLKTANPVVTYAEIAQSHAGATTSALDLANKVIEVRRKKLPDVLSIPNVGSFFKNPIVSSDQLKNLKIGILDLVSYPQPNGQFKLAAGQLIDKLGFKGQRQGSVCMYEKQALVMVNLGQGCIEDVHVLAQKIKNECWKKFGIYLETEPIFW